MTQRIRKRVLSIAFSIIISAVINQTNTVFGYTNPCVFLTFTKDDKSGYVDRTGKVVIPPKFDSAGSFDGNRALAKTDGLWGIIDKNGRWVVEPTYFSTSEIVEDALYVWKGRHSRYSFINKNGQPIGGSFDSVGGGFQEGLAAIELGDKWGYIDKKGNIVIAPQFEHAGFFSDGIARVRNGQKTFYINKLGQKILEMDEKIGSGHFSDGLAFVEVDNLYGFMNIDGKIVIEPQFQEVEEFSEGFASVYINGKHGFINKQGKLVVPARYEAVEDFSEGLAVVRMEDHPWKYGYVDQNGDEVIPRKYNFAGDFRCGMAYVEFNGKWTYIDKKGKPLFPARSLK